MIFRHSLLPMASGLPHTDHIILKLSKIVIYREMNGVSAASGEARNTERQVAGRSKWQTVLSEAGGISAAVSEESMKRLQYCLHWLQVMITAFS
jgi:hypothetical protein